MKIILLVTSKPFSSLNYETKSLFTPWKLASIKKPEYLFCTWFVALDRYLFQLIVLVKPDFSYLSSFKLSWVAQVMIGT